ncbi:uncharacterized protein B0I36DRAFT_326013 [Microdochium trichocladiopsis]|uniref:Guanine deaminase n=1 Tax=Microdochium trichocladiopsis TaxID=1682393 RepID=A0A9P9BPT2_9PEZI|nr:uncharacterized protein B0I36DRAFT_326013 [Microdochium trichocladiopsis]KAH7029562.1 hypothetical protein B0I36DRAFT_326013 [Microdochium trichocladiopsis]
MHLIFHGTLIHSASLTELEIIENGLIVIDTEAGGTIVHLARNIAAPDVDRHLEEAVATASIPNLDLASSSSSSPSSYSLRRLSRSEFLIPGFVDTHNHAPQYAQRGLGQSMHILDWLAQVTFPNEARFADPEHARRVYARCVRGFLRQGITTASYYGSMHAAATNILADQCLAQGQRAFVGKCNMNREAPDYYRDASAQASLDDTRSCIAHIKSIDPRGVLLKHVLTPRFAITCDEELLRGLGQIAREEEEKGEGGLPIQTHFNEAEQEIVYTKKLFPQFDNEADLYEHFGLLGRRTILAHCCHMTEYEFGRLRELDCGVAHCPVSNMTVGGGFMAAPIRQFLKRGVKVGLGTDSGGGFSSSILDAMRQALVASNAHEVASKGEDKGLTIPEVFYLATMGGARVCCLEDKIGSFEVGKEFDAILVNADAPGGIMTMVEEEDSLATVFDKFVMTGDDRNMEEVFVRGRSVKV